MSADPSFGAIVKERRNLLGLTQAELARRVGCAAITIRKIEADSLRPSVQIAQHLAVSLDLPEAEHLAFVRLARAEKEPTPIPTPPPAPEEIGLEDLSGRAIKGYQLGERIGFGGHGAVYQATQATVERDVAIKIILPKYADRPEFIRRFEAEAQLVARLEHPHIVPLYDYWREPGVAYLVMRLLKGGNLQHKLSQGALDYASLLIILEQICAGLHTAHRAGVIHRDIKPANVLLDDEGNAYLADFGVAKNIETGNGNLTQGEVVIGSPAYISPEQIMAEPVSPQTDIYSLGVMVYELVAGKKPFRGPTPIAYIQQHLNQQLPLLAEVEQTPKDSETFEVSDKTAIPSALDIVIGRATAKDPRERYPDILSMLSDIKRAMEPGSTAAELAESPSSTATPTHVAAMIDLPDLENPYKGLRSFNEADSADFFGRDTLIQTLLARLSEANDPTAGPQHDLARFLAVVGPSGSGKSSVVKAGLLPALRQGGLPNSQDWFITEMLPGPHPFEELEAALLRVAVNPPDSLLSQLQENERGLLRAVNRILPQDGQTELLLLIDQFEEVFTLLEDEAVRNHFLDSLVTAILDERSRLRVIITLRADFTDRPLQYVDFGELVRQRTEFVLPLTPDELEQAITGPTKRAGLSLEAGLVPSIIGDIGDQPGMLPLLQYALTELFERRQGRKLTLAAYQESGGVLGALARRADELYAELDEAEQEASRQLFLRLVTLGEGTEDTRRRVLQSELAALDSSPLRERLGEGDTFAFKQDTSTQSTSSERPEPTPTLALPLTEGGDLLLPSQREGLREGEIPPSKQDTSPQSTSSEKQNPTPTLALPLTEGGDLLLPSQRDAKQFLHQGLREGEIPPSKQVPSPQSTSLNAVISQFGKHRLLTFDHDPVTRSPTVEVAHEALIREWSRLRGWIDDSREDIRLQRLLAVSAAEWQDVGQDDGFLLRGARLNQFEAWAETTTVALTEDEQAYFLASISARQTRQAEEEARLQRELETAQQLAETEHLRAEEQAQSANQLRKRAVFLTAALIIAGILAVAAVVFGRQANQNEQEAIAEANNRATAEANAITEANQRATAQANAQAEADQRATAEANAISEAQKRATAQAIAVGEAEQRATAQADAEAQRTEAEHQTQIAFSRELAASALNNLNADPELSILLALQGISTAHTRQVEEVLHQALPASRIEKTLFGHTEDVNWVIYNPDGTRMFTGSDDALAKVWDAASGELIHTLSNHAGPLWAYDLSPDGAILATGSADTLVKLWDVESGQELFTLAGHSDFIRDIDFSPDGSYLVSASQGGTAKLWDVATGQELFTLTAHDGPVRVAEYNPDGTEIATGGADGLVHLWDATSGELLSTLSEHTRRIINIDYSPDGTQLFTASDDKGIMWDSVTGEILYELPDAGTSAFNSNGTYLATNEDNSLTLWDATSGEEIFSVPAHSANIGNLAFSLDDTRLVSTSYDGTAKVWDATTGQELISLNGHDGAIYGLAISPDGAYAVTTGDTTARVWDISDTGSKELLTMANHSGQNSLGIAISPDGTRLASTGTDGTTKVSDALGGEVLLNLVGHSGEVWDVSYSPDGLLLATAGEDKTARLWDAITGQPLMTLSGHGEGAVGGFFEGILALNFSPDGTRLATAGADGTAKIWDVTSGDVLLNLSDHDGGVTNVVFSPDGTRLATASESNESDARAQVWDATTGQELFSLGNHFQRVWGLAFSPDGKRVVTGGFGGLTKLWDVSAGASSDEALFNLTGHTGTVVNINFSPDGSQIATASVDGTVKIWDPETGELSFTLASNEGGANYAIFSPDGTQLAAAMGDGTIRIYAMSIEGLTALAESRVTRSLTEAECRQYLHVDKCPGE